MRAVEPTRTGRVRRAGAELRYEVYGAGAGPAVVLLPTWEIIHSRVWKLQVGFLSRHFRVLVYDAAGTGRSSRPMEPQRYTHGHRIADALAVMDATQTPSGVMVGNSRGGELALYLGALHPERVDGVVAMASNDAWVPPADHGDVVPYDPVTNPVPQGWAKVDFAYARRGPGPWADFLEFFMAQVCTDPHSSKGIDDLVRWGLEQRPDVLEWTVTDDYADLDLDDLRRRLTSLRLPVLLMHGGADQIVPVVRSERLHAWIPGSELLTIEGVGHNIPGRYPVLTNHLIRDFARRTLPAPVSLSPAQAAPRSTASAGAAQAAPGWTAPRASRRKVLYLSSPVGLGHARRDVAIADELVRRHTDVRVDWLAQDPVTRVLEASGHRVHPASGSLASESAHYEAECSDHALNIFQAGRDMDEISCHNFHVFDDVMRDEHYDLVIADEAWDVDHHLFENAHLKRAPLVWLTDFVGYVPMAAGGAREAALTRDYNLEMLEHVERHPGLRDAAVFVGAPEDVCDGTFGDGLPVIRDWTRDHFDFPGYVTGFDPCSLGEREELRAQVGFGPDETVCVVSVGGTGVGRDLLDRVVAAYPAVGEAVPSLRMVMVTGPRIDPATMPRIPGVEYHGYVDRLYRWLTACDVAVVQGGLTTTMELTAAKVPFVYVPLRHHFEQNHHVRGRLDRYGAGRCMDYDALDADSLAAALVDLLSRPVDYRDVETDGAARAAALIGRLL